MDPQAPQGLAHACGVFGVYAPGQPVAHLAYLGLYALQHRGQESAGIAVSDGQTITVVKDMGLVTQVFDERRLAPLEGHLAIGHNRYSTTGSSTWRNAQPVYRSVGDAGFALGHNGNLTNIAELAERLGMLPGMLHDPNGPLDSTTDSALVAELIAAEYTADPRSDGRDLELALEKVLPHLKGGFSFVLMDDAHLIGARDPHGFWPLVLGRIEGGWVLASETAALDIVGAHFVRDIEPGEMIVINASGVHEKRYAEPEPKLCLFEFVYFARPDTYLYGKSVHAARQRMGEELARQAPVEADMVMPVPESGIPAAQGFARASGIPYGDGLVKNRYVGRTFIQPSQSQRSGGVRLKLNPLPENIRGKRLVVVDDSIVRGTTTKQVVAMLREAGAAEVHFRVSSPPYKWPCSYGMDTGRRSELLAADLSVGEIQDFLKVDSLAYLEIDRLTTATGAPADAFCTACLTGVYPVPIPVADSKHVLEEPGAAPAGDGTDDAGSRPGSRRVKLGRDRDTDRDGLTYAESGVDIAAGEKAVEMIKDHVRSTFRPEVVGEIGGFGGLFSLGRLEHADPMLVSSTDGVGTKSMLATLTGRYDTIGIDCVAMSADDIAAHGAEPLFFLDYVSVGKLVPEQVDQIVAGVAKGCRDAGCALIGGEMSEHPGLLDPGEFDIVGFAVGVVDRSAILPAGVQSGDAIIGIASPGLRSNGYSLARRALLDRAGRSLDDPAWRGAHHSLGEELLVPSVIYAKALLDLRRHVPVHAFVHVTGGGIPGNLVRVLPPHCHAVVRRGRWEEPRIFSVIQEAGDIADDEMEQVFNLGVGMLVVLPRAEAHRALDAIRGAGHDAWLIGEIVDGAVGVTVER